MISTDSATPTIESESAFGEIQRARTYYLICLRSVVYEMRWNYFNSVGENGDRPRIINASIEILTATTILGRLSGEWYEVSEFHAGIPFVELNSRNNVSKELRRSLNANAVSSLSSDSQSEFKSKNNTSTMKRNNNGFRMYNTNQNARVRGSDLFENKEGKTLKDHNPQEVYGPQITDKDGALLDKHDSFYITTKSLLVLFQIMGVMPIMRVAKDVQTTKRTTFNWISKATLWAYLVWSLECIIVIKVGKERLANFQESSNKRFDEVIYNIIFLSILIPHFLLPIASWRHGPQVAIFKNMWTHYQLKYLKITGTPIIFPNLYSLTWGLCIFSWVLSFTVILCQHYLQDDFELWHSFAYYHIIAMLDGFCSLWYINCNAFGTASKGLATNLHRALEAEHPALKLAQYRHLWVDLSHMMQQLGRAYSNMYGIYCMVIFFTTTISLYGSLSEILEHGLSYKEMGLFVIVGYCMTLLYIICNEAYHASRKVGLEFQVRLLNVNLGAIDRSTQREVEMFLVAIAKNPPIMNLDGFTNINRELFTANISFMSTYLIVLMQFKLTLLRQGAKKMVNAITKAIFNTTTTEADDYEEE